MRGLGSRHEPTPESFERLWEALRAALLYELRRCALATAPPSYLGVYGWSSWMEKDFGPGHRTSALDDLMADAYTHVFLKRIGRLQAQLEVKANIDGLVFLYLRNFIHDRRKTHDPLGFRIFEGLRAALRRALDHGELRVVAGDPKVTSSTILAFSSAPGDPASPGLASSTSALKTIVEDWQRDLVPGIMSAVGTERAQLIEKLRKRLEEIRSAGIEAFRFQDLVVPLKRTIRDRWAAILGQFGAGSVCVADGRTSQERVAPPDERPLALDSFRKLTGTVASRLDRIDVPAKTRRYLRRLWSYLGEFARDEAMDSLPSNRQLSSVLEIPRERLPGLYDTLRNLVRNEAAPFA